MPLVDWMVWTVPTGMFFGAIGLLLLAMTVWQVLAPSVERRGFLTFPTTPGDRLFVGLLVSAYVQLVWLAVTHASPWIPLAISLVWLGVVMRWG